MLKKDTTNPTLIISFNPFTRQIPKSAFMAKLPIISEHYPELSIFREHLDQKKIGSRQQPYTANKRQIQFYRITFLLFTFLFLFLGLLVYFKTGLPSYFKLGYMLIKPFVIFLCGILATASLFISLSIQAHKESVCRCVRKAKKILARIYDRRRTELGLHRFFYLGKRYRQHKAYTQSYHEAKHRLHDLKEDAMHLIATISSSLFDKKQKEILYNQATAELNDKLTETVLSFKHSPIQIYNLENF